MPERMGSCGGRDGNEQNANNQLHECFEERAARRNVKAAPISQGEPHENRREQPGVLPGHVARGRNADHRGELRGGAEHLAEPEPAEQHPEQRGADHPAGQADGDADRKLAELAAQSPVGARDDGVEDQCAEDPADRVDQGSLPDEDLLQAFRRPDEAEQRAHDGRSGDDQDDSEHHRRAPRHSEQRRRQSGGDRPGDQHPEHDQADHHLAGVALKLPQVEAQAGVIEDDCHRQGHQWLERRPEQALRVNVHCQRARDKTGRQQHNDRRNAQPAGQHLGANGEHENQADTDQDLVCRHVSLR